MQSSKLNESRGKESSSLSKKFKNFPSNKEKDFLNYFNNIDSIIKDKEIKYIRFIGKEPMTSQDIEEVLKNRQNENNELQLFKRRKDVNRFKIEFDDICSVYKNNDYFLKPTFDFNQNDKFFKTRHYFNIFLKMITKVLIRNRAEKRLKCIDNMIKSNNIKTSDDFHEYNLTS